MVDLRRTITELFRDFFGEGGRIPLRVWPNKRSDCVLANFKKLKVTLKDMTDVEN